MSGTQAGFAGLAPAVTLAALAAFAVFEARALAAACALEGAADATPAPAEGVTAGAGSLLGARPHAATAAIAGSSRAHAEARVVIGNGESSHIGRSRASSRTIERVRAGRYILLGLILAPVACASEPPAAIPADATLGAETGDSGDGAPEEAAPDACAAGAGDWIGFVEEYTGSGYRLVRTPSGPLIVTRDDAGLYAYAGTCSFAACTLAVDRVSGVATCPCHGDAYDFDGLVLSAGPATTPLAHFALTVCGRRVYVDASRTVPHTVRTVP